MQATIHTTDKASGTEVIITGPSVDLDKPPSNKDITQGLKEVKSVLETEKPYLSPQGQNLVEDAAELADATGQLIKDKNKHERFQKLYLLTKDRVEIGASESLQDAVRTLMNKATGMGSDLKTEANDLNSYIRSSVYNLIMSTEYRHLAFDFIALLKELTLEIEEKAEDIAEEFQDTRAWRPQGWDTQKMQPVGTAVWEGQGQKIGEGTTVAEKATEILQEIKPTLSPKEEQHIEALRYQFNDFLKHLRSKKEYQTLINNFFKYSDEIYKLFKDLQENPPPEVKDLRKLIDNSWDILSDFAGEKCVKKFRSNLNDFFKSLNNDSDIHAWWEKAKEFITDSLKKPDTADTDEAVQVVSDLIRTGRKVTQKYRADVEKMYDQVQEIFENIRDDPTFQNFGEKLAQLGKDLALNRKGEPDPLVMQESFSQITTLLARFFNNYLVELPVERIEIYSPNYDVILQDIKTQGMGFAPESIEVSTASRSVMNLKNRDPSRSIFRIAFRVDNINPVFKDFQFYFHHKTFPEYEDSGRADLQLGGNGLSAKVILSIRSCSGRPSRASLDVLWVKLDALTLHIGKDTKHRVLSTLAAPIFSEVLRSRIESTISAFLRKNFNSLLFRLNTWFESNPLSMSPQVWTEEFRPTTTTKTDVSFTKKPTFPNQDVAKHTEVSV